MVIKDALKKGCEILKNADIESFLADSLILLCYTLKITKEKYILIAHKEISEADFFKYLSFINKRAEKYPVKYITGECEFMGLSFKIKEGVLIPRPDTEILVEKAISLFSEDERVSVCDLCCGSGCIGLSIIHFLKNATLFSYDISEIALKLTMENALLSGLKDRAYIEKKDILAEDIEGVFDIIVSNPPYISSEEYKALMDDVRLYEPEIALHAPSDALKFYKRIISQYTKNLKEKGFLLFEVGYNQGEAVKILIDSTEEFTPAVILKDFSGNNRVVFAEKK